MNENPVTYSAVIVGGGPVGLLLGLCFEHFGLSCRILEQKSTPSQDSRSLGIHPPSLELLQTLGMSNQMIQNGIKIRKGHAFSNANKIGTLSFQNSSTPFNFILSLPQSQTEQFFQQKLKERNGNILIRNAKVTNISEDQETVSATYESGNSSKKIHAHYLIGCDGKNSFIRKKAGIPFKGQKYPDTYVMGDFTDNTNYGNDAAIFLCNEGLIESFPLPNDRRRWVIKTHSYQSSNKRQHIEQAIHKRINHSLATTNNSMLSSFGVEKRVAHPMVANRIILCGDAAHVVSPIGGQGMNLGWLGAWDLAHSLNQIMMGKAARKEIFDAFEQRRSIAIKNSIRRSELNMKLGRKFRFPALRNGLVSLMLRQPLSYLMTRLFTMHGIERWII